MKMTTIFKTLGPVDLKNVQRDSLLLWIPLLPLILALLLRVAMPKLAAFLYAEAAFDLEPYYPLLMSSFVLLVPSMVGMIVGFLLLDERDEQILRALLVTPMPLDSYLLYRISLPMILGTLMTLMSYPLAGLTPISFFDLLIISLLGSITAPLLALFLAAFAENKVAGFAMAKMGNGILMIPTVSYFIDGGGQLLAGIVPAYWPAKAFWLAAAGESYGLYVLVGLLVNLLALRILWRRFKRVVYR